MIKAAIDTNIFRFASTWSEVDPDIRASCFLIIRKIKEGDIRIMVDREKLIINEYKIHCKHSRELKSFLRCHFRSKPKFVVESGEVSEDLADFFAKVNHDPNDIKFVAVACNFSKRAKKKGWYLTEDKRQSKKWRNKAELEFNVKAIWSTEYSAEVNKVGN